MELAELWANSDAFHNLALFLTDVQIITNVLMFIGKIGPQQNCRFFSSNKYFSKKKLFRAQRLRLEKMDTMTCKDKDQELAYVTRVLSRDFPGISLCR